MGWFKLWHYVVLMLVTTGLGAAIIASGNNAGWGFLAPGIVLVVGFNEAKERL